MKKGIIFLLLILSPCGELLAESPSSNAPAILLLAGYDGYSGYQEFAASGGAYLLSAFWSSAESRFGSDITNLRLILGARDKKAKMAFSDSTAAAVRQSAGEAGADYALMLHLEMWYGDRYRLSYRLFDRSGEELSKKALDFIGSPSPETLASGWDLAGEMAAEALKHRALTLQEEGRLPVVIVTNLVTLTNAPALQTVERFDLTILGSWRSFTLANLDGIKQYGTGGQRLSIPAGMNSFHFITSEKDLAFDDKLLILHSMQISNLGAGRVLDIGEFRPSRVVDTFFMLNGFLSIGRSDGYPYPYSLSELQCGVRLPIDEKSKIKIALELGMGGYFVNGNSPGICLGYERTFGLLRNQLDYLESWYVEAGFYVPGMAAGLSAGLNVRLLPVLLSGRIGLGLYLYRHDDLFTYKYIYDTTNSYVYDGQSYYYYSGNYTTQTTLVASSGISCAVGLIFGVEFGYLAYPIKGVEVVYY